MLNSKRQTSSRTPFQFSLSPRVCLLFSGKKKKKKKTFSDASQRFPLQQMKEKKFISRSFFFIEKFVVVLNFISSSYFLSLLVFFIHRRWCRREVKRIRRKSLLELNKFVSSAETKKKCIFCNVILMKNFHEPKKKKEKSQRWMFEKFKAIKEKQNEWRIFFLMLLCKGRKENVFISTRILIFFSTHHKSHSERIKAWWNI